MKFFTKSLGLLIVGLAALLAMPAQAQQYTVTTAVAGGTNNIAAPGTNTYSVDLQRISQYDQVSVALQFALMGAGTELVTATLKPSIDGTNFSTQSGNWIVISAASNGTNVVTVATNLTINSVGFLRLTSITNGTTTNAVTNLTFTYATKPKRNGQ